MASKYAKHLKIPEDFPSVLKDFTRECLRQQQERGFEKEADIYAYAVNYFQELLKQRDGHVPEDNPSDDINDGFMKMSDNELEVYMHEIFNEADVDGNGVLDQREFKRIFQQVSDYLKLSTVDIHRILMEAHENENGIIEYREFVPLALEIIQTLRARYASDVSHQQRAQKASHEAKELLLHGMSKDQIQCLLKEIFIRADQDQNGYLNRVEFIDCIRDAELGFTRKEINLLMSQVDSDGDGKITYAEFVPVCFELLVQLYANELIDVPTSEEQISTYLVQLFASTDEKRTGLLTIADLKECLRSADLGLTRIQITGALAEAQEDSEGYVDYEAFSKDVSAMILNLIDFKVQTSLSQKTHVYRQSEKYHKVFHLNQHEFENILRSTFTALDTANQGTLPYKDINQGIQTAFPHISQRQLRALLADVIADSDSDLIEYETILRQAFPTLQWLQEYEHVMN